MTLLDEARHELQLRRNVLADLEARWFMADRKRDRDELHYKISEAKISIREIEYRIARLERAARN